jgi:hypothetical protein
MARVFVTGDIHNGQDMGKLYQWYGQLKDDLTLYDCLMIAGDTGLGWEYASAWVQGWLQNLGCTVLFVDGNHDDHWTLDGLATREMFGSDVGVLCDGIYHLRRGRVYEIAAKKWFTFGGALSIDEKMRTGGVNWWPEEIPSKEEFERGVDALIEVDWKVDYVLTHTAPKDVIPLIGGDSFELKERDRTAIYLRIYRDLLQSYDKWFCGHFHKDLEIGQLRVVFGDVVEV